MEISYWIFVFSILLVFWVSGSSSIDNFHQPFPIVEPDPGHTKLRLSREGLEAISRITTPISAVAVIGPYRSGKSFLLNQLLSLSCDEGFGVGHMRDTKTKGIWVWGTPLEVDIDGVRTSVFYLDTEGFESVGKSNVYDDRIFALATVMSSVLIYNLPETHLKSSYRIAVYALGCGLEIREADISRLSFAVELAEEFYGRVKGQDIAFEPAKLLWLIQRDFLQGKSVKEMVDEALRHVPNSDGDKNIDQVNQIRDSLAVMGDNSTAFSLPQPHLMRTKLCDLKDDDLDPMYVKKRGQLKELVASIIRPKIVQGKYLNGKEFVSFLEQILDALNKGEIPSTGSLVEVFNKGILERCLKLYSERMGKLRLPMPEQSLQDAHERSREEAMKAFEEQHFGRHHAKKSADQLDEEMKEVLTTLRGHSPFLFIFINDNLSIHTFTFFLTWDKNIDQVNQIRDSLAVMGDNSTAFSLPQVFKNVIMTNEYQSTRLCEALYTQCEDRMDQLQVLRLPTMAKFDAGLQQCNQSFEQECVGPSKANYEQRIMKMLGKSRSLFIKEYNQRLFNWLVAFSLVMVVIGRFIIKFILVEMAAWILFIFLETYTRMFWSAESLYYNPVWHFIVSAWETIVYSPILDLDRWAIPIACMAALGILYCRCYGRRKHGSQWLLPLYNHQKVFLSTDGAVARAFGCAASGGVARDHDGNWIVGFSRFLGYCSPFEAEVWGILDEILILLNKGYRKISLLTDNLEIVQVLSDLNLEDFGITVLRRVRRIMRAEGQWKINHISRNRNLVADRLAKLSLSWKSSLQVFNEAPEEVIELLHGEKGYDCFI
ncbi:hypothetical protein GOBAR_AA06637 [Gossypium barbadense]|uniref:GB1/RHD3-type G domain-containing protein n=1 Tax=Gossypium barbadense TaxID=3634 RepID=A0A2P5YEB8_GOSBA|nr:hypothetical protein GOBAR_AA06637 [Gossypium barbadense]